jgi:hypothetical protein
VPGLNPCRGKRAIFILVRRAKQGRSAKTANAKRSRSKKSIQAVRAAREPWLLVASTALAAWAPKKVAKLYRQRMQIEESFRDMKSQHFGEGLECSRSDGIGRFTVLVPSASLAAFLLWLLGTAAEPLQLHQRLRPGSRKRRAYSRLFLVRLLLVLDSYRHLLEELFAAVGNASEWVAADRDASLGA